MGHRVGAVVSGVVVMGGLAGLLVAFPAAGEAASMGGAKWTLSLTKDYTASPWTHETEYGKRALGKLGFGIKNVLLGWTDLIVKPKETTESGGNLLTGIGVGLKDAVENEIGGALHLVTFPITAIDVPLPGGGTQLLGS